MQIDKLLSDKFSFLSEKERKIVKYFYTTIVPKNKKEQFLRYLKGYIVKNKKTFLDEIYNYFDIDKTKTYELNLAQLYKVFPQQVSKFADKLKLIDIEKEQLYSYTLKMVEKYKSDYFKKYNQKLLQLKEKESQYTEEELESLLDQI